VFTTTLGPNHPNVAILPGELRRHACASSRRWREARACAKRAARILGNVEAVNDDAVALTGTNQPGTRKIQTGRPLVAHPSAGGFCRRTDSRLRKVIEYTGERISRREGKRRWDPARSYLFLLNSYWRLDGAIGGSGAELISTTRASRT
jgi:hypothetical protein